jgi:hypothetical protein
MPFFSTPRRNSAGSQPRRRRSTYQNVSAAQLVPPTHLADSRFVRTRSGSSLVTVPRSRRSFSPSRTCRSDGGCHHRRLDNANAESPESPERSVSASSPSRQQRARECQFEYFPTPRISSLNWVSIHSSTQLRKRDSLVATQPA